MANRNRNKTRNRTRNQPSNAPSPPQETARQSPRRFLEMPPPIPDTEISDIRLCPDPEPTPPPDATGENGPAGTRRESRANSVKRGIRSKLLFPLEMMESINDLTAEFSLQMKPCTALERWLVSQMAISTVQCDESNDQLLINKVRVIERVGTCWDDDCAERSDKLGARLPTDSYNVQRALLRTKHGVLFLLDKWTLLGEAIESSGGLDDTQLQTCYALLGIEQVYRNGCSRVPAGTDAVALRALVARQVSQLCASLERTLNARSDSEKEMAQLGLARFRDSVTRGLRSDLNRAHRRFSWALDTLQMLKKGADAATIIDPHTGTPIAAGPPPSAVPDPNPPKASAPPQPQPSAQPAPAAPPSPPIPPLPAGCSDEVREMWMVAAGAILSKSASPSGDEPGPPPTA